MPSKVDKHFTFTLAIFQGLAHSLLTLTHRGSASLDSQVGRLRKGGERPLLSLSLSSCKLSLGLAWTYKLALAPWGHPACLVQHLDAFGPDPSPGDRILFVGKNAVKRWKVGQNLFWTLWCNPGWPQTQNL